MIRNIKEANEEISSIVRSNIYSMDKKMSNEDLDDLDLELSNVEDSVDDLRKFISKTLARRSLARKKARK